MKYNKVLLVRAPINKGRNVIAEFPPTGIGYLAQALEDNSMEYDVLDMLLGYNFENLIEKIDSFKPNIIGLSLMSFLYKEAYNMIKKIKTKYPELIIVVGGPHITTMREKVLEECEEIDYGVTLEGEKPFISLCKGKEKKNIKGILYRKNGEIIFTGHEELILKLDAVSFPKYKKFELKKYLTNQIGIITSRGCPYNCIYCPVPNSIGKKFRYRSPENIVNEIKYWYNQGYKRFLILDDNFTLIKSRVEKFCEIIKEERLRGLKLSCPNGVRADRVDYNLLKMMKESGFVRLAFGVEAGNNKILNNLKKGEHIEIIDQRIKEACELGYIVSLFFLIGSPGETWEDFMDSIKLAQKYPVYMVRFYNLIPFPDTELMDWVTQNNYLRAPSEHYLNDNNNMLNEPLFETPEMNLEQRKKAYELGNTVQKKVLQEYIRIKLKQKGIIGNIASKVISNDYFFGLFTHNKFIRRISEYVRSNVFGF